MNTNETTIEEAGYDDINEYLYRLRASLGGIWAQQCNGGIWRVESNLPEPNGYAVEIYDSYEEMTQQYSVACILNMGKTTEKWILRAA